MRAAVKLQVTISKDRLVQLPADLPEGQAEIDSFARLTASQPHPLSVEAAQALDEANRGER